MKAPGMHSGRSRSNGAGVAFAGTVFVHATLAGVLWQAPDRYELPAVPVYKVELVAAPRPEPEARKAPEAVQRQAEQVAPAPRPRRTSVAEETPPPPKDDVEREPETMRDPRCLCSHRQSSHKSAWGACEAACPCREFSRDMLDSDPHHDLVKVLGALALERMRLDEFGEHHPDCTDMVRACIRTHVHRLNVIREELARIIGINTERQDDLQTGENTHRSADGDREHIGRVSEGAGPEGADDTPG